MVGLEKEAIVKELTKEFSSTSTLLVTGFQGLKVTEVQKLRQSLAAVSARILVVKNTLARRALKEVDLKKIVGFLDGPSAITFAGEDPPGACRILVNFGREHETLSIRGGLLDGELVSREEIKKLAELPSREVLLAQVLTGLNASPRNFVGALTGLLRKLVLVIDAIAHREEA